MILSESWSAVIDVVGKVHAIRTLNLSKQRNHPEQTAQFMPSAQSTLLALKQPCWLSNNHVGSQATMLALKQPR